MCNTNNNQPLQPLFGRAHHIAKWMHPIYKGPAAPGESPNGNLSLIDNPSCHDYHHSYKVQQPQHKPNSYGMVPPSSSSGRLHQYLVQQSPVGGIRGSINLQNESRLCHPPRNTPMAHQQDYPLSDVSISSKSSVLHPSSLPHRKNKQTTTTTTIHNNQPRCSTL